LVWQVDFSRQQLYRCYFYYTKWTFWNFQKYEQNQKLEGGFVSPLAILPNKKYQKITINKITKTPKWQITRHKFGFWALPDTPEWLRLGCPQGKTILFRAFERSGVVVEVFHR